jgi:RNA polymerase sigma-70 factor (ECF subfamily)
VQDCLERALGRWRQRRPGSDARAWLFTILHNLYLNGVRQTKRRGAHVEYQETDGHISPGTDAERSMIARDALNALNCLSPEQRSLLLLIAVEDLSYQQAADVFGVPTGTIMSRLSRARETLRELIEGGARITLRRVK